MQIFARAALPNNALSTFSATLMTVLMATIMTTVLLMQSSGVYASGLDTSDATLAPCPSSPNCVSSQATDADHFVEPLSGASTPAEARAALTRVLSNVNRIEWSSSSDRHIRAAFTSLIFRFVDDVVFIIEDDGNIAVRSASRMGHSDLGANRNRVERLRKQFSQALLAPSKTAP